MKILIVEDDPISLKLASEVLQMAGHVIMLAASADQAIASIETVRPDIILLDIRLRGIQGLAVARQCRENPQHRNIPIVAVTAYPQAFGKDEALAAGCDDYLVKPYDTRTLAERLQKLVSSKAN